LDPATARFYRLNAEDVAGRYEAVSSPVARYFRLAFPEGGRVLDVGAGSGRDLVELLALGYDARGVEPVQEMAAAAIARHPQLQGRIASAALPSLGEPFCGRFDGILCSAVLMHLPEADLFDAAFALRNALRPHGRLLLSLPLARGDVDEGERGADGRLFKSYAPGYLQLLFERIGFQQVGRWDTEDALARAGTRWYTLLFELRAGGPLRAADQIEGILNRDRKVATYKLALFRALAELALQEPHGASWRGDGRVGVPVMRIAEKWFGYYWPIFAAREHVPQSQSEGIGEGAPRPLKFRHAMLELMAPWHGKGAHGGLTAWQLDRVAGRLTAQAEARRLEVLSLICQAIREGPVKYSGGALESGTVFEFDRGTRQVLMSAELWRELSLLGHWVADAVVLRWAELTERFGKRRGIDAGGVLPLLLARPEPSHSTSLAREAYLARGVVRCAWTGRRLDGRFDVDHVIPFSLWGNNDLWNLLPAHGKANAAKSDRLPGAALLRARRSAIVDNWELLRDSLPMAFDQQAEHLLGRPLRGPQAWQDELFVRLREAVEVTACQRGVERWDPMAGREGADALAP
jgi:SAM-dependent methyltransferase/5-methylcytosine-specific restriction endonuclease McrA